MREKISIVILQELQ